MNVHANNNLLAELVVEYLAERTGYPAALETAQAAGGAWLARLNDARLVLSIDAVSSGERPEPWLTACEAFARRLAWDGEPGTLLWLPSGAEPPVKEPALAMTLTALQAAWGRLEPGDARDVGLPIEVIIARREEGGAYASAFGGLAPLWAQFTDRVQGYFQIDSRALHRLPEDEVALKELIDRVVGASKGLAVGDTATVETEDLWLLQRLRGGRGTAILALPPGDETESGTPLRKRLRQILRQASEGLAEFDGLKVLALVAHYPTLEGEPVGAALRGQDPALFAGLDLVVLVANGIVKPLFDITRRAALQRAVPEP